MSKHARIRGFPSFLRMIDPSDAMLNYVLGETDHMADADAIIYNTFDELEQPALDDLRAALPPTVYTVGPLNLLADSVLPAGGGPLGALGSNLWREDGACLGWLDGRAPPSVVYVNYGSIAVMTKQQLLEFAWGLAGSGYAFLWVVRPDLVVTTGEAAALPPKFLEATGERGLLASWCPQEAVGLFLTHSGWNSTLEPVRRGADAVVALHRGAADQLPVQARGVGRGHGGRRRRAAGGGGGEDTGGNGRGEGGRGEVGATGDVGLLASWCPQEAVGLFLTHSGWNSTLEPVRRGADAVVALHRGAADQLPVQARGVGRGHGETTQHLFKECPITKELWTALSPSIGYTSATDDQVTDGGLLPWWEKAGSQQTKRLSKAVRSLQLLLAWELWSERNRRIFQGEFRDKQQMVAMIQDMIRMWAQCGAKHLMRIDS
uniref:Glycosyltransferase n=1 Tax=Oryza brachyantha TaxID=4533 RepID=J3LE54_ORYBR